MFSQHFHFRYINSHKRVEGGQQIVTYNYSFRGKTNKRYIVLAELHPHNIYAVKFYLQEHKSCAKKYQRLTSIGEGSRIITTLANIIKVLYAKDDTSSFAFYGMHSEGEPKGETKRYRLYARILENLVSSVFFQHEKSAKNSAYLLLNRKYNDPDLLKKVEAMFKELYEGVL